MKRLYGELGGPQEAQAEKAADRIASEVHDNSPFGHPYLPWSTSTASNRTRKLSNKASIRKLSNNDLVTIHIISTRLGLPANKMALFEEVAEERSLYEFLQEI